MHDNDTVGALTSQSLINYDVIEDDIIKGNLSKRYCVDKLDSNMFTLTHQII